MVANLGAWKSSADGSDKAARFGYLVSGEGEASGRVSAAMIRETVVWDEEE